MDERGEALLAFWLGPLDADGLATPEHQARWFAVDPAFDDALRRRFGALHEEARAGRLDRWAETPRGRLALVILLDQLSRNLHRGRADAFSADAHALALTRGAVARGEDRDLALCERVFLYLPLEHAEDLAAQELSVERFRALAAEAPERARALFDEFLDYAVRHRDVIARFGRFPHRNPALARASTPEELAFVEREGGF
jgi:uncharacterized protein (DUF924 family)